MPDAILFVPSSDFRRWLDLCGEYAARHGYTVIAVISDWDDVQSLAREHSAVVIAGHRDHLPADRLPRIELVTEEALLPDEAAPPPTQRRPRFQR